MKWLNGWSLGGSVCAIAGPASDSASMAANTTRLASGERAARVLERSMKTS